MSIALHRENLKKIFQAALLAVHGRECVSRSLMNTKFKKPLRIVALGKAAQSMAEGAIEVIDDHPYECLVICKSLPGADDDINHQFDVDHVTVITAAHPVPDESSLVAGRMLIDFIQNSPDESEFLFLLSGGASSLVEVLPEQISLAEFAKVNQWLLASGFNIRQINTIRKSLSCIKGGRLVKLLGARTTRCLIISDVPGDDLSVIGSGLLVGDLPEQQNKQELELPGWISELTRYSPVAPKNDDACFGNLTLEIIANNSQAQLAAAKYAESLLYKVQLVGEQIDADVKIVAKKVAHDLIEGEPGIYIWGGESTIKLPQNPGQGGRNQQLALEVAAEIAGNNDIIVLIAATDGSDGPTSDAGGIVDGATLERGQCIGLSAQTCLDQADAGRYLLAVSDLFSTGTTGTNVMDLIIGLKLQGNQ